ncbi:hypothetical protein BASA61_003933 [Batrachochytrium salamandrivorans]|nr:hypothetical protein BASA60_008923 [Batrachochytrium salamandrivorans]KAH6568501.1 hypothetical protein BASA62_005442 [Batrachochytrium salamandrivorans]KAH6594994.1 hypothetical protein BASA61_003933 [Batrachochytrium salamandrivorans]KAH9273456.1 hypothetical protein BASA83_004122 [Batrachochytrium salamandrivorans]KAJ1345430.1 hypothetical protein BSLG_000943 [Batrachochytrium salamandrivorans]
MRTSASFLLALLASVSGLTVAQSASGSTVPPKGCEVCTSFATQLQTCKTDTAPASNADWVGVVTKLTSCVCPVFASAISDQCSVCIQTVDPTSPATTLFFKLKQGCFNGAAANTAVDLASVFNVTISASDAAAAVPPPQPSGSASPGSPNPNGGKPTVPRSSSGSSTLFLPYASSSILASVVLSLLVL